VKPVGNVLVSKRGDDNQLQESHQEVARFAAVHQDSGRLAERLFVDEAIVLPFPLVVKHMFDVGAYRTKPKLINSNDKLVQ